MVHGKVLPNLPKGLGKVLVFPALSGVSRKKGIEDTIIVVAEKQPIKIGAYYKKRTNGGLSVQV